MTAGRRDGKTFPRAWRGHQVPQAWVHDTIDAVVGQSFAPPDGVRLEGFVSRLVGLSPLGQRGRSAKRLWVYLDRCTTIHTLTMTRRLDLVWVDAGNRVLRVDRAVPPLQIRFCRGAHGVWERVCQRCDAPGGMLQSHLTGASRSQSGWGMVETLLMLPLVLLLFALIIQVSLIGMARLHLGHALREGLRYASVPPEQAATPADGGLTGLPEDPGDRFSRGLVSGLKAWARFHGDHGPFDPTAVLPSPGVAAWTGTITAPLHLVWELTPGSVANAAGGASSQEPALPDHLSASVRYSMPLKLPLVGVAFARGLGSQLGCTPANQISPTTQLPAGGPTGLCAERGRWHWVLRTGGRIAVPPSLFAGPTSPQVHRDGSTPTGAGFPSGPHAVEDQSLSPGGGGSPGPSAGAGAAVPAGLPHLAGRLDPVLPMSPPGTLLGAGRQHPEAAHRNPEAAHRNPEVIHRHSLGGSATGRPAASVAPSSAGVSDSIRALLGEVLQSAGGASGTSAGSASGLGSCPLQST